ncbi:transmembrane protease serine 9-like [Calliphora vicina]|uniref:transmembrane protease serine 9-like n=1 Tax=Calliphora vicina TaxID=7373 RepID=UPI00325A78C7
MCGRILILSLIVYLQQAHATTEGFYAERGMYGFVAAITEQGKFICGGTIVSKYFIISAAHCFKRGSNHTHIKAIVGTHDLSQATSEHIKNVTNVVIHPRFSVINMDFDIAVVRLEDPLLLEQENLQRINLAENFDAYYDDDAVALGWGHGGERDTQPPSRLRYVPVYVWNRRTCNSKHIWGEHAHYIYGPLVSERMLCASVPDGGSGTCDNDDGAALVAEEEFLGIMSWRFDCHSIHKPSVYTSIPLLRTWIIRVLGNFPH